MSDETAELAERANEIFDRVIRPQVDVEEEAHKYVAIDIESEDFKVGANQRVASDRLLERHPEARGHIFFAASAVPTPITSGAACERKPANDNRIHHPRPRTCPAIGGRRPGE